MIVEKNLIWGIFGVLITLFVLSVLGCWFWRRVKSWREIKHPLNTVRYAELLTVPSCIINSCFKRLNNRSIVYGTRKEWRELLKEAKKCNRSIEFQPCYVCNRRGYVLGIQLAEDLIVSPPLNTPLNVPEVEAVLEQNDLHLLNENDWKLLVVNYEKVSRMLVQVGLPGLQRKPYWVAGQGPFYSESDDFCFEKVYLYRLQTEISVRQAYFIGKL